LWLNLERTLDKRRRKVGVVRRGQVVAAAGDIDLSDTTEQTSAV